MIQEVYTVEEAATLLRCDAHTIRRAIRAGKIQAAKVGKGYAIARPALEAFFASKGGGNLFANDAGSDPGA